LSSKSKSSNEAAAAIAALLFSAASCTTHINEAAVLRASHHGRRETGDVSLLPTLRHVVPWGTEWHFRGLGQRTGGWVLLSASTCCEKQPRARAQSGWKEAPSAGAGHTGAGVPPVLATPTWCERAATLTAQFDPGSPARALVSSCNHSSCGDGEPSGNGVTV
jgi:hypothetical protein